VEIFLYFADISDMREKSLHIPDIEVFCGKMSLANSGKDGNIRFNESSKFCLFDLIACFVELQVS